MSVQVLISTYKDSIHRVPNVLKSLPDDTPVLVVHQVPDGERYDYDAIFERGKLEVVPMFDRGLARSRNRAVELASGDILVPTDDDVRFLPGAVSIVEQAFSTRSDAQVNTFQVLDENGMTYKDYPTRPFRHTLNSIRRVFSVEIAARRDAFVGAGLRWDEDFGLNARYPGGLEQAFLKNMIDLGLPAYYHPHPIVIHPQAATGYRHTPESGFFRGAVYAKLFGFTAYALLAAFAGKNAWRTGSVGGSLKYTRELYRGAADYLSRNRDCRE